MARTESSRVKKTDSGRGRLEMNEGKRQTEKGFYIAFNEIFC
jgi:hypothetical protein